MAFPAAYNIRPVHPSPLPRFIDGGFEAVRRFQVAYSDLNTFVGDLTNSGIIPGSCIAPTTYPGTTLTYVRNVEIDPNSLCAANFVSGTGGLITNPSTQLESYTGDVTVIVTYRSVEANLVGDGINGVRNGTWVTYGRDVEAEFTTLPSRGLYWEGEHPTDYIQHCITAETEGGCLFGDITVNATSILAANEVVPFYGATCNVAYTEVSYATFKTRLAAAIGVAIGDLEVWFDKVDGDVRVCFITDKYGTLTADRANTSVAHEGGRIKHDAHPQKVTPVGNIVVNWNFVADDYICEVEKTHDTLIGSVNDAQYSFPTFDSGCALTFEPETLLYMGFSILEEYSSNEITTFCSGLSARRTLQMRFMKRRIIGLDATSGDPLIAGWNHFLYDKGVATASGYKRILDILGNPTYELQSFDGIFL